MLEKISKPLYNGEVVLDFYPEKHRYKKDWKFVTSVTWVTWIVDKSPQLMKRAVNCYRDLLNKWIDNWQTIDKNLTELWCNEYRNVSKEATDIWTLVHDFCEAYANWVQRELPEQPQARNWANAFLEWVTSNNIKFIENEKLVYSVKHEYCWKLDTIIEWNWKRYLADFKTSKAVYLLEYWMQTSAYLEAYQEETWMQIDWRIIIKLWKETWDFEIHILEDHEKDFQAFLSALTLVRRKKETDKLQKDMI